MTEHPVPAGRLARMITRAVAAGRAAGAAASRAGARVAGVVTPVGWTMLAITPVALGLGYGIGWTELVVLGFAAATLLACAAVYLLGRSAVRLDLVVPHRRVVVGEPAGGRVEAGNTTRRRLAAVTVEVPVGTGLVEITLPALPAGTRDGREFTIPTQRRGLLSIGPVRTVRADPVGLVRREVSWGGRVELVVHPKTIGIPSVSTGLIRDLEGQPTRDLTTSDISFHALREYLPGDERRHIHWKATARTGTHMVRQFEQSRRSHLVVALSTRADDYAGDDEFELAVSAAGSLGARAIRDSRTVSVVVGESAGRRRAGGVRALSTASRNRLLDDLATVDRSAAGPGVVGLSRAAAERVSGVSVAFIVVGSASTPAMLRGAASGFPLDVEVVAVVCDPEAVPGMRRVGTLTVLTIGYLDDLKQALGRSAAVA